MCTDLPPTGAVLAGTDDAPGVNGPEPRRLLSRRTAILGSAGVAASTAISMSGASPASADSRSGGRHGRRRVADLTYTLGEDFPAYTPGEEAVRRPGASITANGFYQQRWDLYEHTGTHVDAPAHFNPNGR